MYSDHSDQEASNIIDIDAVSGLGESAPTSLYRDRNVPAGKAKVSIKGKEKKRKVVEEPIPSTRVKTEPVSPVKQGRRLIGPNEGVLPPVGREDDAMTSGDEDEDRDDRGRRVRGFARTGGAEEVHESQRVNLSESESEGEEESMEGDFLTTPGYVRLSFVHIGTVLNEKRRTILKISCSCSSSRTCSPSFILPDPWISPATTSSRMSSRMSSLPVLSSRRRRRTRRLRRVGSGRW